MVQRRLGNIRSNLCPVRAVAIFALLSAILASGGCNSLRNWRDNGFKVGPNYFRPKASVAEKWIDFNDRRIPSEGIDDSTWWTVLNDSAIDGLVRSSYQQNLTLRTAGLRVLEAQSRRAVAAGNLFPQFQEAFGGYRRDLLSKQTAIPSPVRAFSSWAAGFNVAWELDFWGRFRRAIESADADLDASVENYDDILVSLIGETATAYVQLREFQQRLKYARANVRTQEGSLKLAEARFRNGAVSELDVTQAKSNLGQTRALIPVLERQLREANNRLCVLMGIPPRDLRGELGEAPIPKAPATVVVGIPAQLLRRRPDIRRAEREVAAQSARIGIAAAELYPRFTINGSINWQAADFSDLFSSAANAGFIGPAFNWNILNYGRIVNAVRAEDARFQQLAVDYQQTVLKANEEVENAVITFLKSQEQVKALEYSVKATQRSVELALIQYRGGSIDFNRVFNLESALVQQQDQLAEAQANVVIGLIRVYKALGGGWQIRYGGGTGGQQPVGNQPPQKAIPPSPVPEPASALKSPHDPKPVPAPAADPKLPADKHTPPAGKPK